MIGKLDIINIKDVFCQKGHHEMRVKVQTPDWEQVLAVGTADRARMFRVCRQDFGKRLGKGVLGHVGPPHGEG